MVAGMQVPTLDEITKKEQSIKEALNYKFNDKDIEDVSLFPVVSQSFIIFLCVIWRKENMHLSSLCADREREGQIPKSTTKLRHEENTVTQRQGKMWLQSQKWCVKGVGSWSIHLNYEQVSPVIWPNPHSQTILFWLKAMAEESGDGDRVKVIQDELNELEERAEALDRQRTKNISAIRLEKATLIYL